MAAKKRQGPPHYRRRAVNEAKALGRRIRQLRLEAGYDFDAWVETCELSRAYCSEIESGHYLPTVVTLRKIATALEMTIPDLLVGSTPRERLFDLTRRLDAPQIRKLLAEAEAMAASRPPK